ncbi:hypothetical protein [Thalassorhabdomicrobium marinisediminis]|uniref:hypothetical protein n=1 Tax=Thalassorhabdomicrobium marinisediminis TaxID=2170577 RepID=UPI00249253C9|nr:hypothetical protein [Thalassorhabdomicrobium marinisediminis]
MKHLLLAACLTLPLPALAQEETPESGDMSQGFSLMEEGAKLLFRGIMGEMEPRIEDFSGMARELEPALEMFAQEMGPALFDLMQRLDSVRYYEAPELLPNGDIILRRKPDAPEDLPDDRSDDLPDENGDEPDPPEGAIDL